MSSNVIIWLSFITAAVAVWALGSILIDLLSSTERAIQQRIRSIQSSERTTTPSSLFKELSELNLETATERRLVFWGKILTLLEQSDSNLSVIPFLMTSLGSGLGVGILVFLLKPLWFLVLFGFILGVFLPYLWLSVRRQKRLTRLRDQLPEAFDLMRRAVQSGQTMQMSMQMVSKECPLPIRREFARCCEQYDLGLPQDTILKELARRNDIMEFRIFVVAMLVQRLSGGNPVELLENLAQRVRKRSRLRERVRAFTSEGRMQALVLCVLPVAAFIAIYFLDRNYAQVLLDRPWLLGSLVVAQLIGTLWIRTIVNFEY